MAEPIPLSAPDGTVYAWACGECRRVLAPDDIDTLDECEAMARAHCGQCPSCGLRHGTPGACRQCDKDARRAFKVLACVGMAVAADEYAAAALAAGNAKTPGEDAWAGAWIVDCLAALCGVSPETVRGWRT